MKAYEIPKTLTDQIKDLLEVGMDYETKRVDETTLLFESSDNLFEVKVVSKGLVQGKIL